MFMDQFFFHLLPDGFKVSAANKDKKNVLGDRKKKKK